MNPRFSVAPFGEPGRLTIRLFSLIPAIPRDSIPRGVISILFCLMYSAIPGHSFSMIDLVASGVISRGAKPVPPVVMIK